MNSFFLIEILISYFNILLFCTAHLKHCNNAMSMMCTYPFLMAVIPPYSPHKAFFLTIHECCLRLRYVKAIQLHQVQQGLHVLSDRNRQSMVRDYTYCTLYFL